MDESSTFQNRRSRRSNFLMNAALELSGTSIPVRMRNLSREGALIEGDRLPVEGSEVVFKKGDLSAPGRIAWVTGKRAGVSFIIQLDPEAVLRHVPAPRARVAPEHRRPGLRVKPLNAGERKMADDWVWTSPDRTPDD